MSSNLGLATGELQHMEVQQTGTAGESLWKEAWKRLLKDKVAVVGGIVIILLVAMALFAPLISPHDPYKQYPNGTSSYGMPLPIGSHGKTLTLELAQAPTRITTVPETIKFVSDDQQQVYTLSNRITFEAGVQKVEAEVKPLQAEMARQTGELKVSPQGEDLATLSIPISSASLRDSQNFALGTDSSGRDVLSRLIYGSQISLQVGMIAVGFSVFLGAILGLFSGYFGGWVDTLVMRLTDIMMSFPDLLLVMAIVAIINPKDVAVLQMAAKIGLMPEMIFICIAIAVVSWTSYARLVRSQVLTVREMEFVEASKSLGASDTHIMFRHILPNVAAPVIVVATMGIASAIMTEASLSFLGFGVKPPTASWGSMIYDSLGYFREAPLFPMIPGLAIAITVFAFNLFGDGVRDALDPRLK